MAWKCKKCGGEVVEIDVVPFTIIREIKKSGKAGKALFKKQHKITHDRKFQCLNCKENAPVVYKDSLKMIANWEDKE